MIKVSQTGLELVKKDKKGRCWGKNDRKLKAVDI